MIFLASERAFCVAGSDAVEAGALFAGLTDTALGFAGMLDGGFAGVVAGGFAGGVAGGFAGVVAGGFAGGVAGGFAGGVAGGFAGGVAGGFATGAATTGVVFDFAFGLDGAVLMIGTVNPSRILSCLY